MPLLFQKRLKVFGLLLDLHVYSELVIQTEEIKTFVGHSIPLSVYNRRATT